MRVSTRYIFDQSLQILIEQSFESLLVSFQIFSLSFDLPVKCELPIRRYYVFLVINDIPSFRFVLITFNFDIPPFSLGVPPLFLEIHLFSFKILSFIFEFLLLELRFHQWDIKLLAFQNFCGKHWNIPPYKFVRANAITRKKFWKIRIYL